MSMVSINQYVAFVNGVDDDTQCLAWSLLGVHDVYLEQDPVSLAADALGVLDSSDWNRVTPGRKADMATGNIYQFFEAQMRGGFVPYHLRAVLTLPCGAKVALFVHARAMLGDIAVMMHPTSDMVLRLQVTGSRNHLSILAETMAGTAAYHDTAPLTRLLTVAKLKALMVVHLQATRQLGAFQRLILVKVGQMTPLAGHCKVWNPAWMGARRRMDGSAVVARRLHVKTQLVQLTLNHFW
jgi:hypothetical protein